MLNGKKAVNTFVFDCVCHIFNFDKKNALGPPGDMFDEHLYAFHQFLTKAGEKVLSREEFFREWGVDEIYEMVIEGSDTDMIVAQPLPLTDLFHDGLSPWEKCAEMAGKHPDRAVFWGSINPLEGKKALDLMEVQVKENGAKAFKLYIVRYPNLSASIAATVNFISRHPRVFADQLAKMLWWCGEDKIIYGGEAPIWHPQWALEAFWNFELPEELTRDYGYPPLTQQAKRKILGENLARLHGVDVVAKKKELGVAA